MSVVDRLDLGAGYEISRVIRGGWQLAGGHGDKGSCGGSWASASKRPQAPCQRIWAAGDDQARCVNHALSLRSFAPAGEIGDQGLAP